MKRIIGITLLLAMAILFSGCPYSSEYALDEKPVVKAESFLIGTWELRSSSDYSYKVTKTDDYYLAIEKKSKSSEDVTNYKAFLSKVNDQLFLNVSETADTESKYYFYKIQKGETDALLELHPVTENITETFKNSAELRTYFTKYSGLSFFYEKDKEDYLKTGN